jgi:hypothetical protein
MREAILPLPQYAFMAWYLVKHKDNFTFTHMSKHESKLSLCGSRKSCFQWKSFCQNSGRELISMKSLTSK